jgi:hypothetical protein
MTTLFSDLVFYITLAWYSVFPPKISLPNHLYPYNPELTAKELLDIRLEKPELASLRRRIAQNNPQNERLAN